jgi:alpha-tubulin suppressor-like RCC1 family protein
LENIKKVESGVNYSMALSDDGRVYVWGNNTFGQLGTGSLKNEN